MAKKIKVALASDHAGFALKDSVKKFLEQLGYDPVDLGTNGPDPVDYPDYAQKVAGGVSRGEFDRGILVCGTGIGMSISANRVKGVRAALVTNNFQAEMAAKHNNANILIFGGRVTSPAEARTMLNIWLDTEFEGGRHEKRLAKIDNFKG